MQADPETLPRVLNKRRRGPSGHIRDALQKLAGGKARIASHNEHAWASITFAGTRHQLDLLFEGYEAVDAGELFIAALPDHEFTIPRQLVADATIRAVDERLLPEPRLAVSVELLLLEDA